MVGARTFAMAANRIIDRQIDARNPRTAGAGAGHRRGVACAPPGPARWSRSSSSSARRPLLNPLCLVLAPLAVVPLVVYPYGKRFTN